MSVSQLTSLSTAFSGLSDSRKRWGTRHPFAGVLALTFLGLLCRQTDFATIARWAKAHRDLPREPPGLTSTNARARPPSAGSQPATPWPMNGQRRADAFPGPRRAARLDFCRAATYRLAC